MALPEPDAAHGRSETSRGLRPAAVAKRAGLSEAWRLVREDVRTSMPSQPRTPCSAMAPSTRPRCHRPLHQPHRDAFPGVPS